MELQQYWEAIQQKVCVKCIDGDGHGNCRLHPSLVCPLKVHLPLIVHAVGRVTSDEISDYVRELRKIVCARCAYQSANGYCGLRSEVECALDRYFPLVVEAIEAVKQQSI